VELNYDALMFLIKGNGLTNLLHIEFHFASSLPNYLYLCSSKFSRFSLYFPWVIPQSFTMTQLFQQCFQFLFILHFHQIKFDRIVMSRIWHLGLFKR
jgi:hypothetical protein